MTRLRLYNTLSRSLDALTLREPGKVGVYCCGPTVYDVPHAGHARAALAPDVLVRHLRASGFEVTYVRNITDVDDKILDRARQNGEEPLALSRRMSEIYQDDMRAIGCVDPDHEPRVSDHVPQILELIQKILDRGVGYVVDRPDGARDVYFSVKDFPGYGKLSGRRLEEMRAGARVEIDETKRDPADFALWKGSAADEWGWDGPWGRGRPGWHIECSAMSLAYLGYGFDVHAGGMDLVFPHHENEIAQSEAANPDAGPMVTCWIHNGFVNVDREKMSKSLGNFVTVRDVLTRNDPEGFRYYLLGVHYRGPIQFDTEQLADDRVVFPGVDEAERRIDYLYETLRRLDELVDVGTTTPSKPPPEVVGVRDAVKDAAERAGAALDDDLNTSVALACLGEMATVGNDLCDLAAKRRKDAGFVGGAAGVARQTTLALRKLAGTLGLLGASREDYVRRTTARRLALRGLSAETVEQKVRERMDARRAKDFARADALRDELVALGVAVKDSALGTEWSIDV